MKNLLALLCAFLVGPVCVAGEIKLEPANTVVYRGGVTDESASRVMLQLMEANKERGDKNYPIYLVLDSPGGSVEAGNMMIAYLRTLKNVHTITIFSASMAAGIVEANPGKRYIVDNGILMFHRAKGTFQGQFETGELESQLRLWQLIVRTMESDNAKRIGLSLEDYKAKVVNEWWMYGAEAVTQKAADETATIICSQELLDEREHVLENMLFFTRNVVYSGCPLLRVPLPQAKKETEEESVFPF
jgi:ATP-dependent protease ClpP protease subunit